MVVGKKMKSKRIGTRQRTKVERKVREHHRKLNKASGSGTTNSSHKRKHKDPGIPASLPGRDEYVRQMQAEREKELAQRKLAMANNDLQALAEHAQRRSTCVVAGEGEDEEEAEPQLVGSAAAANYTDSSKRAYYREFKVVLEKADVLLVVLDARDPMGSRVPDVERAVMESGGRKRLVYVLNKTDLVPADVRQQWVTYLRRSYPTIAFRSVMSGAGAGQSKTMTMTMTTTSLFHPQQTTMSDATTATTTSSSSSNNNSTDLAHRLSHGECLGADELIQLLKNYCRNLNIKTAITVGVVGYPNVGKSSLINSLRRSKVCQVGASAGVTKTCQEIHLDRHLTLLDSPGIVFATPTASGGPNASVDKDDELSQLFLRNCIKVEQLPDPIVPVELIVRRTAMETLQLIYTVPRFETATEFLTVLAHRMGKLKRGGVPNLEATAKIVLNDWNSGKIPFHTLPPSSAAAMMDTAESSACTAEFDSFLTVVSELAPAFDIAKFGATGTTTTATSMDIDR